MAEDKFRLITRSDFDGLASAILLKELDLINEVKFVHPKDVQDGLVDIQKGDITTNLPYSKAASYVFDHHISELARVGHKSNYFLDPSAPSAARIVWDSFGGKERFKNVSEEMMKAVDQADTANYTLEDILNPKGWTLLAFIMDARTGLGRFKNFRINNYDLMMKLVDLCRTQDVEDILKDPDVKERVDLYFDHQDKFIEQLKRCTRIHKTAGHIYLRDEEIIYAGNRFMVYALFPQINISVHEIWGKNRRNVVFAAGKSIFNRTSKMNIGEFMLHYGGGGHVGAGTCQVPIADAPRIRQEIITAMVQDV